jgi:hypothetical protein
MATSRQTGLFGKLPAHGDFVHRNLPAGFVNRWDEWLQHFVAATREQIGEHWLEVVIEHAEAGRRLTLHPHGAWVDRIEALRATLETASS